MGIIIFSLSDDAGEKLISTVGNTVDTCYINASLTTVRIMLSVLSIWVA